MTGDGCYKGTIEFARRSGGVIWKFIGNKVKEAGNEAEVIGSDQSKLSFPGKGSGSPRSTSRKERAVGREDVGPHYR